MDIENISSKPDIYNYLESNVEAYKEEIKNIIKHSDFTSSQQQDLNDIAAQYYYSLNDIVKSIKLLSE